MFWPYPDFRAYQLDWTLRQTTTNTFAPALDPTQAGALRLLGLDASPGWFGTGMVVDAVAYAHAYRVFPSGGNQAVLCTELCQGSPGASGVASFGALAPGTWVLLFLPYDSAHGIILGALPPPNYRPGLQLPDYVHQASRCGLQIDAHHNAAFGTDQNGMIVDWSAGRPLDSLTGERGLIADTGLKQSLDNFMAQLAVDETTGVWAFYRDQFLRLAGRNVELLSGGSEQQRLVDRGELHTYIGEAVYPWEQMGAVASGTATTRSLPPEAVQFAQRAYAALEPADDRQQAFHRRLELGGYLGQGGREQVLLPPAGPLFRYAAGDAPFGVFREQRLLTGRYLLESAKGIHIRKGPCVTAPKRIRRPEDASGDDAANYKASGVYGQGPAHAVVDALPASDPLDRLLATPDALMYAFHWEADLPLHRHALDWQLPEPAAAAVATPATPGFGALAGQQYLPTPAPVLHAVDHRYGEAAYFPNTAYISLNDDGSLAFGDGFGASIQSTGGSTYVDAPGDLVLRAGRKIVLMAGDDVVIRAANSVDISATGRDVRIKAGGQLQAYADSGGVLIESNAPANFDFAGKQGEDTVTGGVVLRASRGTVAALGNNVYLRTDSLDGALGVLTLDAGGGLGRLEASCDSSVRYIRSSSTDYYGGGTPGNPSVVAYTDATRTDLVGDLRVAGSAMVAGGGLVATGDVQVLQGHIYTSQAAAWQRQVAYLADGGDLSPFAAQQGLADFRKDIKDAITGAASDYRGLSSRLYAAGMIAAPETMAGLVFSFRTDTQYGIDGTWAMPEPPWQQSARVSGQELGVWAESPVRGTLPYPGSAWSGASLVHRPLDLVDPGTGLPVPRASGKYESATPSPPERLVPAQSYFVTAGAR